MNATNIISADDLLLKMRSGVRLVHEIKMRDLTIPVRVLSIDEINQIRRDAIKQAILDKGDDVDRNVHIQKCTLKMASCVEGNMPLLGDRLLGMLSVDEINYLYNEYIRITESVNPTLDQMSEEQFRALVDNLKKNTITPMDLSLPQLRTICSTFVDLIQRQELRDSQKDN